MKDITWKVLIAHAKGEEEFAEKLAIPIREAGYEVAHRGTVMVGESFTEEASKALQAGDPVVLCGTIKALGTKWARQIVHAARNQYRVRVFCVRMEDEADVESLTFDECIAQYWQDPTKAERDLIASLKKYYPLQAPSDYVPMGNEAEQRYRKLALESCDIIDLANLPEDREIAEKTHKLALRRLYVALRVQVEITASKEIDESLLETMEKRRSAKQLQLAGRSHLDESEWENKGKRIPIGERLAEAKRLVVLGDPGAGKTTMVRWITTAYLLRLKQDPDWQDLPDVNTLPNEDWLPIIIRCRDLDNSKLESSLDNILIYTLLKAEMSEAECAALREILRKKLQAGEALLLIDGLDEITDPRLRARFCDQIENICIAYPQAPIIVTSRIVGYREMKHRIGRGFEHVTVADLTREDKDDFANRWCEITEPLDRKKKATEDLIKDIHSSDRIERLTGNPMLLTTMALVKRKVGKLPSRRADLYWEAVQVLLNWRREVDEPIDHREAIPQLNYIAYAMCDRGVQQLRQDEMIELLEQIRQERPENHMVKQHTPEEFLRLLEHRTGILVEVGHVRHNGTPVPCFEFRHLTFQEYLAGLALVKGYFPQRDRSLSLAQNVAPLAGRISKVSNDDSNQEVAVTENWREALRLCVASCNDDDVDEVLRAILKPLDGENAETIARPRAVMAALCLADEPNASDEVAREVLQEFVKQIGKSDGGQFINIETTVDAAAMELANSQWTDILRDLLAKEFQEREAASRSSCGDIWGMVVTASVSEDQAEIHEWCVRQVSRFGLSERESIEAALSIEQMAWKTLLLLPHFHNFFPIVPGMVEGLLEMLVSNAPASHAAAKVLRVLNIKIMRMQKHWRPSVEQKKRLISFISHSASDTQAVALVSGILGNKGEKQAVEPLIAKLDDSDKDVRRAVAQALGNIKDQQAVEPLIAKLDDSDKDVRQVVAQALGNIKDQQAVEPLIAKLDDSDKDVRRAVAQALVNIKDQRAVEPLIAKLDDSDKDVRRAVAQALGNIKDQQAVEPLIAKLNDSDEVVRRAVAQALGNIKDQHVVELLIAKLDDSDKDVRRAVVGALGDIKDQQAVEPLIAKLDDSDKDVRRAVVGALGNIKDQQAVEPLIAKLDDSDKDVRRAVAQALVNIKDQRAVEPLIAKLDDSDEYVRQVVALALGNIKDQRPVEPLIAKLDDSDEDVRQVVALALGNIKDQRAVEPLIAKLNDSNEDVRQAVEAALVQLEHTQTIKVLFERLSADDRETRVMALKALSHVCNDEVDRKLLSRDLDAFNPFLDPQEEIDEEWICNAAEALEMSVEEVRSRYQALAQQFPLKLNFADNGENGGDFQSQN